MRFPPLIVAGAVALAAAAAPLAAAPPAAAFDPGHDITVEEWREDLELLRESLESVHPNAWFRTPREAWDEDFRELWYQLPLLTDDQAYVRVMQLVAGLRDGHTRARPADVALGFNRLFPFRTYLFTDGLYVISATKEHEDLVGARIVEYGTRSALEALDLAASVYSCDNEFTKFHRAPLVLMFPRFLHALGLIAEPDEVRLLVEDGQGPPRTVTVPATIELDSLHGRWFDRCFGLPAEDVVLANDASGRTLPRALSNRESFFWFEHLEDRGTVYFQFNVVARRNEGDGSNETFTDFCDRLFRMIDENAVERLVIDLRFNSGGNNQLLNPLLHGIIRRDAINRTGRLFAILGRQTFSAAMSCAGRLEYHTNTLFAGEPSGSLPNQYGDARSVVLPNSGLTVGISTVWWMNTDALDRRELLPPHVPVQWSFADFRDRHDPVLDAVLAVEGWRPISEAFLAALEERGLEAAKAAYRSHKREFPDGWQNTKSEVNELGYRLLREERQDAAIAAFELNVETYPDYANGWDSLAEGWMTLGDHEKAIRFYRRSLELDPANTNAEEMIRRMEEERAAAE